MSSPHVLAVHRSPTHSFSKKPALSIRLIAGLGVDGDAHAGETVKHRSHAGLLDELNAAGFTVNPGDMGENITTLGLDLLALPTGTRLTTGDA
jgi:MOSC domain-containing protein YiiM